MTLLQDAPYDVLLLDIWLPDRDGLEVLSDVRQQAIETRPEVIIISGHGTIETAVKATKLGAYDFLEKPLSLDRTLIVVKNAVEARRLRSENEEFKRQFSVSSVLTGESVPLKALRQQIRLDGAHQWTRAHLRRIRHRQGTHCALHSRGEPSPRSCLCRVELRRNS